MMSRNAPNIKRCTLSIKPAYTQGGRPEALQATDAFLHDHEKLDKRPNPSRSMDFPSDADVSPRLRRCALCCRPGRALVTAVSLLLKL